MSAELRTAAKLLGVLMLIAGTLVAAPTTASAGPQCTVDYKVTTYWGTGFQAQLVLSPGIAVTSWSVSFDVAAWSDLWFYSDPVYIEVKGSTLVAGVK